MINTRRVGRQVSPTLFETPLIGKTRVNETRSIKQRNYRPNHFLSHSPRVNTALNSTIQPISYPNIEDISIDEFNKHYFKS